MRSSSSSSSFAYPRAAVAVTIQSLSTTPPAVPHYLLVQRANPPDLGKWSLPGGKIEVGEPTLDAAQREITEETQLQVESCEWLPCPFMTTDSIVKNGNNEESVAFHYLIAHCFARAPKGLPLVVPSEDALDAKWYTLQEIEAMQQDQVSELVVKVIERAEELHTKDALF